MAASINKAFDEPISVVVLVSMRHVGRDCFNFLSYYFLESFLSLRAMLIHLGLEIEKNHKTNAECT